MTTAEESYYVIERGGRKKKIQGVHLADKLEIGDILLLNRDGKVRTLEWLGLPSINYIKDSDHFVCWKDAPHNRNYRVRGSRMKEMMRKAMVIDYFKFNTNDTSSPTMIPLGSSMAHKWKVTNAKTVYVNGVGWHWESHQHSDSVSISYMGVADKTYNLDATDYSGNTIRRSIHAKVYDDRKWDECKDETRPVMADMFCPMMDYDKTTWNEWPGNCLYMCVYDIDGHRMTHYTGNYSNAYVEIYDDSNVRWYKGKIKEIKKRSSDGEIIMLLNKEYGKGTAWNSTTKKYDIRIRGVW